MVVTAGTEAAALVLASPAVLIVAGAATAASWWRVALATTVAAVALLRFDHGHCFDLSFWLFFLVLECVVALLCCVVLCCVGRVCLCDGRDVLLVWLFSSLPFCEKTHAQTGTGFNTNRRAAQTPPNAPTHKNRAHKLRLDQELLRKRSRQTRLRDSNSVKWHGAGPAPQ